jgi:hypothetical protein
MLGVLGIEGVLGMDGIEGGFKPPPPDMGDGVLTGEMTGVLPA